MSFRRIKIESIYEGLYDGPHATPKPSDSGPVFLGIGNISPDGQLDLSDVRHIAEEDYAAWTKRVVPEPGDIVFTYEATLNRYAIIPQGFRGCLGRRLALIRPDLAKVNPRFLFLYFFGQDWRNTISGNTLSGATVDRIPLTKFPEFEVSLPPRLVQDKIAEILSAYDDLIGNDTRRVKILGQMVQMLYREWFVNFRFPGHEGSSFITSGLGEIPEGWQVSSLGEVTSKIGSGATPRGGKESYQKEGVTLIRSLNIYDYSFAMANLAFINPQQAKQLNNVTIEPNDVLLNITGASVGRCSMVPSSLLPARVNQHVAIVRAKSASIDPFFLLDSINNDRNKQRMLGIAQGGATREALTKDSIAGFPILLPPLDLVRRYGQIASAFHTQREKLSQRITNLRTTRDLLLPKLVSGEVSVEQIEQEVVAEMV